MKRRRRRKRDERTKRDEERDGTNQNGRKFYQIGL